MKWSEYLGEQEYFIEDPKTFTCRSNDLSLCVNMHDHMSYQDKNWVQSEYYAYYLHSGVKYVPS